jgi:hypothetical protein
MWKQEDLEFEAIPGKSSGVTVSKTKQNKKKRVLMVKLCVFV